MSRAGLGRTFSTIDANRTKYNEIPKLYKIIFRGCCFKYSGTWLLRPPK